MTDTVYKRVKIISICVFFCVCFIAASNIDITCAPDEAMRYPIAYFIYSTGSLPNGMESSLIHQIWGFSYALYPYLTSVISAFFMKLVSLFAASEASLLIAARMTSVLAGTGTMILCFKIGEKLFRSAAFSLLFAVFTCFLPQFVFLCSYQNNDSFAVFTSALIIYYWICALKTDWSVRSCIGIGIGCGLCALSYYNAYVFLLASLALYFADRLIKKHSSVDITGGALIIFLIAFAISGWFFIRNATLHNGDILGFKTATLSAEQFAIDGYKPSQLMTPAKQGLSFTDTFIRSSWLPTVLGSFIGCFSYMTVKLPMLLYGFYSVGFLAGIVGFFTKTAGRKRIRTVLPALLQLAFVLVILVNLGLFLYTAYYNDYQAQGRYMMPSLLPLMLFITEGFRSFSAKLSARLADPEAGAAKWAEEQKKRDNYICAALVLCYFALFLISYIGFMIPGCKVG